MTSLKLILDQRGLFYKKRFEVASRGQMGLICGLALLLQRQNLHTTIAKETNREEARLWLEL